MKRAIVAVGLAAAALGCAGGASDQPARVSVEVLRGFSPDEIAIGESNAPIVMIFDSTQSMAGRASAASSRQAAAQRAAARFVGAAPPQRPLWLYAMGSRAGSGCQPPVRGTRIVTRDQRPRLLRALNGLSAQGEGGLAAALEQVRSDLAEAVALPGSRVVVFSDLGRQGAGDVCRAASDLVRAGARLDVVAIGDAPAPECLSEPGGLVGVDPPPPFVPEPVVFRLEVSRPEPMTVGCSVAGGLPIAVTGGRATVVVDLDPPLRVEAYFAPGRRHVLQVVDFPMLEPPERQWRWLDAAGVSAERSP